MVFPHPVNALPSGLLAIGGDLSPERLLLAYRFGIFPWYSEGEPIMWWCTRPRFVLYPSELHIPKSMRPLLNRQAFRITRNTAFKTVMEYCRDVPRFGQSGTWITHEMITAYTRLHEMGYAESVEVWQDRSLVAGLYGVRINHLFYGESMFSLVPNASKYGLIKYVQQLDKEGCKLIDCQQETEHLKRFGARPISLEAFLETLRNNWQV